MVKMRYVTLEWPQNVKSFQKTAHIILYYKNIYWDIFAISENILCLVFANFIPLAL